MESEPIRFIRDKEEFMTNITDMSVSTNVITLKTTHPNSFRRGTIKTRIFILQVNNKIIDTTKTFKKRKIRYTMSLLREVIVEWTVTHTNQYEETIFNTY